MRWIVSLALLTACGRVAFDDRDDAAPNDTGTCVSASRHDEDGDGVDDACDVCPHLIDDQADGDFDGVGDACDPEPANPRQQIVLFDPLVDDRNNWNGAGTRTFDGTGAHLEGLGDFSGISQPIGTGTYLFQFGGTVTAADTAPWHVQVTAIDTTVMPQHYFYCELYADPGINHLAFTYTTDGIGYATDEMAPRTTSPNGASGTLSLSMTSTTTRCDAAWAGETSVATGTPHGIVPTAIAVEANHCDATIDWFIEIRTN